MIASLDELVAALGRAHRVPVRKAALTQVAYGYTDLFLASGSPGAATFNSVDVNGTFPDRRHPAAIPIKDTTGQEMQVGRFYASSGVANSICLYDRIWHNKIDAFDTAVKDIVWPAGAQRHADGEGVELMATITTLLANTTAATWTCSVEDDSGNIVTATATYDASAVVGRCFFFTLPAGSNGVRRVLSFKSSVAQASGAISLSLVKRIVEQPCPSSGIGYSQDGLALGMPTILPGACLAFMVFHSSSTSSGVIISRLDFVTG